MADRKISDLTALTTPASGDYLPIVDISEAAAASKNKRITVEELMRGAPDGTAAAPSIAFESDPNTGIYSPGADQVAISTNGTGRLFVGSDGSVGVGGSNLATVPLLVQDTGNGVVIQNTASGNYAIGLLAGTGSQDAYVYQRANAPLIFGTNNTERMRLTSKGLLGLGTSSPSSILTLSAAEAPITTYYDASRPDGSAYKTGGIESTFRTRDSTLVLGSYIRLLDVNTNGSFPITIRGSAITFGTVNGDEIGNGGSGIGVPAIERMRIDQNGRVGIGTTGPSHQLDVVSASTSVAEFSGPANASVDFKGSGFVEGKIQCGGEFIVGSINNYPVAFVANNTERARIDSDGRLLVGTSTARDISTHAARFQLEGVDFNQSTMQIVGNANSVNSGYLFFGKSRGTTIGSNTVVQSGDTLGDIRFHGADGSAMQAGAQIIAQVDGTPGANDMPGRLVFSVTADGAASPTEALRISNDRSITVSDGGNVALGTTTGTKIGTATTQKIGFYNATPVVQPTAVADATDAATVITQLNALLAKLRTLGIIAT
jgi:hypothetical protein